MCSVMMLCAIMAKVFLFLSFEAEKFPFKNLRENL